MTDRDGNNIKGTYLESSLIAGHRCPLGRSDSGCANYGNLPRTPVVERSQQCGRNGGTAVPYSGDGITFFYKSPGSPSVFS